MIQFKLSKKTELLKPYLRDILLYSGIHDVTVEVGAQQAVANSIFIQEGECETLEDVMSKFALSVYNEALHTKCKKSSFIALRGKYNKSCSEKIASVIEKAVEPVSFFTLESVKLHATS